MKRKRIKTYIAMAIFFLIVPILIIRASTKDPLSFLLDKRLGKKILRNSTIIKDRKVDLATPPVDLTRVHYWNVDAHCFIPQDCKSLSMGNHVWKGLGDRDCPMLVLSIVSKWGGDVSIRLDPDASFFEVTYQATLNAYKERLDASQYKVAENALYEFAEQKEEKQFLAILNKTQASFESADSDEEKYIAAMCMMFRYFADIPSEIERVKVGKNRAYICVYEDFIRIYVFDEIGFLGYVSCNDKNKNTSLWFAAKMTRDIVHKRHRQRHRQDDSATPNIKDQKSGKI